ncbi:MAG: hypothetical protein R3E10_19130 [Gemmatimonadota bacterium]
MSSNAALRPAGSTALVRHWAWVLGAGLLTCLPLQAQESMLVSSEVAVSSNEARLDLELVGGQQLRISLSDGQVWIGSEDVASYRSGDNLDRAWRALLAEAIALSGESLSDALVQWSPPEGLAGEARAAAERIDRALEEAIAAQTAAEAPQAPTSGFGSRELLRLLSHANQLAQVGDALEGVDLEELQLYVGDDAVVARGETVDRSVLVVDADLDVEGRITGDVIVVGGRLRLEDGAEIEGDVRLFDAQLTDHGEIGGSVERVRAEARGAGPDLEEMREQIRADLEREIGRSVERDSRRQLWRPFRNIAAGIGGILENLLTFGVLCAIGAVLLHFGGNRLDVIAETARRYPARSAAVGLAGAFLLVPAWVLGIVALAISIVGIPLMIAWAPLFPLAAGVAILAGGLAVAMNVGEWIRTHEVRGFEWAREPGAMYRMAAGLFALTLIFVAANTLQMAGSLLGFLHGMLSAVGVLAILALSTVGFGAVLLTRAGSRPDLVGESFTFDDWRTGWRRERWYTEDAGTTAEAEPTSPSGEATEAPAEASPSAATSSEAPTAEPEDMEPWSDDEGEEPEVRGPNA